MSLRRSFPRTPLAPFAVLLLGVAGCGGSAPDSSALADTPLPIFDVHMHALAAHEQGPPPVGLCLPLPEFPVWDPATPYPQVWGEMMGSPPCEDPVWSPMTDEEVMERTLAVMERRNVYGLLSGGYPDIVARWLETAPHRFIPSAHMNVGAGGALVPDVATLRAAIESGQAQAIGEVTTQYAGILPDDPILAPYWALAEELDVPVWIHVGPGPPGVVHLGAQGYRGRMHSALTMEEVLVRHPRLRVSLAHGGYPLLDDLLALLYAHPQVYLDLGVISMVLPRAELHRYIRTVVEAGHGKRILFGSDQMVWPEGIEVAIDAIESAPYLSESQKRDILYHNAARFLRFTEEEIARHHGR